MTRISSCFLQNISASEFHSRSTSWSLSHCEHFTGLFPFSFISSSLFSLPVPLIPSPSLPYTLPPILHFFLPFSFPFLPLTLHFVYLSSSFLHSLPPIPFSHLLTFAFPSPPFLSLCLRFLHSSPFTASVSLSLSSLSPSHPPRTQSNSRWFSLETNSRRKMQWRCSSWYCSTWETANLRYVVTSSSTMLSFFSLLLCGCYVKQHALFMCKLLALILHEAGYC